MTMTGADSMALSGSGANGGDFSTIRQRSIAPNPSTTCSQTVASSSSRSRRKHTRRAARACLGCRTRKVRCDVVECRPCRNCKWDGIDCVIQQGRRKPKNTSSEGGFSLEPTFMVVSPTENNQMEAIQTPPEVNKTCSWTDETESHVLTPSTVASSVSSDDELPYTLSQISPANHDVDDALRTEPSNQTEAHGHMRGPQPVGHLLSSMANVLRMSHWDSTDEPTSAALQAHRRIAKALPKFTKPPSVDLDHGTLEFLRTSGALTLPSPAAQRSLLSSYIQGVHYNMPCVDIHSLMRAQASPLTEKSTVSLTLYQAIMFAGAMYAKQEILKGMGYSSRPAAIKDLFRRAKASLILLLSDPGLTIQQLLYSMEYDKEPISVVQTLLLFSLRSPESSKQQSASCWIQLAITMIRQQRMHCEAARATLPKQQASLWKRLWWCSIMRDTFNALGCCRAPSIRGDECEISFLELDDFDIAPFPRAELSAIPSCSIDEQTRLAELFIELGDLSLRLARVLWAQFHSPGRSDPFHQDEVLVSLEQWYQDLPPSCRQQSSAAILPNEQGALVEVHRSFLRMAYHATILTLHRHCVMSSAPADEQRLGASLVAQPVNSILHIAADLVARGVDHLMPVTGVALLLPALIIHSLDAGAYAMNYKTAQDAQQSMQILESMRDRFAFAEMAACYLEPLRQAARGSTRTDNSSQEHRVPNHAVRSSDSLSHSTKESSCRDLVKPGLVISSSRPTTFSPRDHLELPYAGQQGFMDLESSSPESFAFEQFDGQPLASTPEFPAWGYLPPDLTTSKEQSTLEEAILDDINAVPADSRDQGIFHYIEDEIIQLLANE